MKNLCKNVLVILVCMCYTLITLGQITAPTNFKAKRITSQSAELSWTTVSGARKYVIVDCDNTASIIATTEVNTGFIKLNNLNPNTTYNFKVAGFSNIMGEFSECIQVKTTDPSEDRFEIIAEDLYINPKVLLNGESGHISVLFKNIGNLSFNDTLYLSWHDAQGNHIANLAKKVGLNAESTWFMTRPDGPIISPQGSYFVIASYYNPATEQYVILSEQSVEVVELELESNNLEEVFVDENTEFDMTLTSQVKQIAPILGYLVVTNSLGEVEDIQLTQQSRLPFDSGEQANFKRTYTFPTSGDYTVEYIGWYDWESSSKRSNKQGGLDYVTYAKRSGKKQVKVKEVVIPNPRIIAPMEGITLHELPIQLTWIRPEPWDVSRIQIAPKGTSWTKEKGFDLSNGDILEYPTQDKPEEKLYVTYFDAILEDGEYEWTFRCGHTLNSFDASEYVSPESFIVLRNRLPAPDITNPIAGNLVNIPIEFNWTFPDGADKSNIIIMKADAEFDYETGVVGANTENNYKGMLFNYSRDIEGILENNSYSLDLAKLLTYGLQMGKTYKWATRVADTRKLMNHSQFSDPETFTLKATKLFTLSPNSEEVIPLNKETVEFLWESEVYSTFEFELQRFENGQWDDKFYKQTIDHPYNNLVITNSDLPKLWKAGSYRWRVKGYIGDYVSQNPNQFLVEISGFSYFCMGECGDIKNMYMKQMFIEAGQFYGVPWALLVSIAEEESNFRWDLPQAQQDVFGMMGLCSRNVDDLNHGWHGLIRLAEQMKGEHTQPGWDDYKDMNTDILAELIKGEAGTWDAIQANIRATAFMLRYYADKIDPGTIKGGDGAFYHQDAVETWWWVLNRYNIHNDKASVDNIEQLMESNYCYRIYDILMQPAKGTRFAHLFINPIKVTLPPHINFRLAEEDEIEYSENDRGIARATDYQLIPTTPDEPGYVFTRVTVPFIPLTHLGILHDSWGNIMDLEPEGEKLVLQFPLEGQSAYNEQNYQRGITSFFDYSYSKDEFVITYKGVYKIGASGTRKELDGTIIDKIKDIYPNYAKTSLGYDGHDAYDFRSGMEDLQYAVALGTFRKGSEDWNIGIITHKGSGRGYESVYSHWNEYNENAIGEITIDDMHSYIGKTGTKTQTGSVSPHMHIGNKRINISIGNFKKNEFYIDSYGWHGDDDTENKLWTRARYSILWSEEVRKVEKQVEMESDVNVQIDETNGNVEINTSINNTSDEPVDTKIRATIEPLQKKKSTKEENFWIIQTVDTILQANETINIVFSNKSLNIPSGQYKVQIQIFSDTTWFPIGNYYHENDTTIFFGTTTVHDLNTSHNIKVYPNPTENILNVNLDKLDENVEISITNILGQKVYSTKTFKSLQISVTDLNKGIYILQVQGKNTNYQTKVMIK